MNLVKQIIDSGRHRVGIASGLRTRPPQRSITHAKRLDGEPGVIYQTVIPAAPRNLSGVSQTGSPFSFLAHSPETAADEPFLVSPEAFLLTLEPGRIIAHGVSTGDERLIGDLSTEGGVRAHRVAQHSLLRRPSIARYQTLPGSHLAVINAYTDNYYHWMMEAVPRLLLLRRYLPPPVYQKGRILLNSALRPFQTEVIHYLGLQERILDTQQGSFVCDALTVPSEAGVQILPASWSVALAREALQNMGENPPVSSYGHPKRIYVARGTTAQGKRRITNEAALLKLLTARGFVPIVPDGLTVAQQADLFSHAEAVVGVHGAGLTNLLFSRPGTRVVELFSPRRMAPCYFILALENGLNHKTIQGSVAEGVDKADAAGSLDSDITVDLNAVEAALE